jgi:hypothetical protein
MHSSVNFRSIALLAGLALCLSAALGVAQDQTTNTHGKVRYIGDGMVTLGDGTRYKLPEGSDGSHLKEGQNVTIQFKNGHNGREITKMRTDD